MSRYVLWFDKIGIDDVPLVGGKNASLGEMYRRLSRKGIRVPNGFAVTAEAYKALLVETEALRALKAALKGVDLRSSKALEEVGKEAREIILACPFPAEIEEEIATAYEALSKQYRMKRADVAVRSSATAEDLPEASFAGQQESFLNIKGEKNLLQACKRCFASLFTNRAIAYREDRGFDHFEVFLSIGVQKMVRSDEASAGVMFTLDPESGFRNVVYITGSFGLGESVVQGAVNPDEFYVFKPTLKKGFKPIIDQRLGSKETKMIYRSDGIKKIMTPRSDQNTFCLTEEEVLQLAKWAVVIEEHYTRKHGKWMPMDIEWAKDGQTGELFIVQARAETVQSRRDVQIIEEYRLKEKGKELAVGRSVGNKIANGTACVIKEIKESGKFKEGDVLVTDMTDPDWVPIMRIASAIVTDRGGRTSHAAIVSRELGLPCIVGTNNATESVKNGKEITIDCSQGEKGIVYEGALEFAINTIDVKKIPKPKTQVMINIGYPGSAFELSFLPSDGVGLAREEFIVTDSIKIHPMALVDFESVKDHKIRKQIEELTAGYKDKRSYFVDRLSMGVGVIAAAFYPRDVIFRFSDFKTNEYANLIGGEYFEPKEENPMIGWRGASRYYKEGYKEGFALECQAIRKVRETFGLNNLKVMVPVCRTPEEGKKVLKIMEQNGLKQGKNGLEVYVMCELPSNVILADRFCEIFDGFSIGSNDLTQMTLAVDRDSELVADIYDERNEAVKRFILLAITEAKKQKRKIGICGDAPSTYPEFAAFLVDCGIDSISLSPDAVIRMRTEISKHEQKKGAKHHSPSL
ncbi:MAG: phosphoenolpyruvate synthase [Chlamydiales bacterium]|nr:phosphoenolpyruvate synthase [Chlamydiales bacterium]